MTQEPRSVPIDRGDIVVVKKTRLVVLSAPIFRHERDAAYYAMRVEVAEGPYKGSKGWVTSDKESGPWQVADSGGFI